MLYSFLLSLLTAAAAPLPVPSAQQLAWQDMEMGMFVHFAPNTWDDTESDDLRVPLSAMNPSKLDTDQWARTAKEMGAKYLVFVAKHGGGFCWWPTSTTTRSVAHIPWRNGHGDVMADVARSCRKFGLKLGVYVSPTDRSQDAGTGGRTQDPAKQAAYTKMFRTQLTELLSDYGPIFEVWFDGSLSFDVSDILRRYAPNAIVFQGPSANIRWVGNEEGRAPYPCWNGAVYDPRTWGTLTAADGNPDGDRWLPSECDCRMRDDWFWKSNNQDTIKSVDQLMSMYDDSVGHGAVMLINNTPDTTGLIPAPDVRRSIEFGQEIKRRYGTPLVYSHGGGDIVEADPSAPVVADTAITMEDIRGGERIRQYVIEGEIDGQWKQLVAGSAIGHEKIDHFEPGRVAAIRIRVIKSVGEPIIRRIGLYRAEATTH